MRVEEHREAVCKNFAKLTKNRQLFGCLFFNKVTEIYHVIKKGTLMQVFLQLLMEFYLMEHMVAFNIPNNTD